MPMVDVHQEDENNWAYLSLSKIPNFFLMFHDFLIMHRFQFVQVVYLTLKDCKSFSERLKISMVLMSGSVKLNAVCGLLLPLLFMLPISV
jgi:hypothetical protein